MTASVSERIVIQPMAESDLPYFNTTNDPFPIFGELVPAYQDGRWTYSERLYDDPHDTRFPEDRLVWADYAANEDKAIYLAWLDEEPIGQIRMRKDWTRYAYIENIAVRRPYRKLGIGALLLAQAEAWARSRQLRGLSLEAQHDNLAACRFYAAQGLSLGGIDAGKYAFHPQIKMALFWYKVF